MDSIQSKTLRTLTLPLPPLSEQAVINDRYQNLSKKLAVESAVLLKLNKLKSGLMHDLLTGKVQVTPNTDAKEAADVQD